MVKFTGLILNKTNQFNFNGNNLVEDEVKGPIQITVKLFPESKYNPNHWFFYKIEQKDVLKILSECSSIICWQLLIFYNTICSLFEYKKHIFSNITKVNNFSFQGKQTCISQLLHVLSKRFEHNRMKFSRVRFLGQNFVYYPLQVRSPVKALNRDLFQIGNVIMNFPYLQTPQGKFVCVDQQKQIGFLIIRETLYQPIKELVHQCMLNEPYVFQIENVRYVSIHHWVHFKPSTKKI